MWDPQKAVSELESPEPDVLFVCGSSRNRDRFLPYFTKIFNLRIDDDTMRRRLEARTDDDWPLGQEGVELMLKLNRSDEKPAGAIDVDGNDLVVTHTTSSSLTRCLPELLAAVEMGASVVSSCEELSYPWLQAPEAAATLTVQPAPRACRSSAPE